MIAGWMVLAWALGAAPVTGEARAAEASGFGDVEFPISCGPAAQEDFERAAAILHSFWYEEARKRFAAVAARQPDCAMAHWGVAMSYYHPVWQPPNPEELRQGAAAIDRARKAGTKTERERGYIDALAVFYRDREGRNHVKSAEEYARAMGQLARKHPDDLEAQVFHALALLGTVRPDDKKLTVQRRTGALLEPLFQRHPRHPGIAHYLIHSYDYPELAERALGAAKVYAQVAPEVAHALHMPSHIFIRLGMWEETISSNKASAAAAERHAGSARTGVANFEAMHAFDYMQYAYLQRGDDEAARQLAAKVREYSKADADIAAAYPLTAIPARLAVERRDWEQAAQLSLPEIAPSLSAYPVAEANLRYARALGAARTGALPLARAEIQRLGQLRQRLDEAAARKWGASMEVQQRTAEAFLARAEGKGERAVSLLRQAATLEDTTAKDPVTPGWITPARELLGELLLEREQPEAALREFEKSLAGQPGRFNSLHGAAQAAQRAGDMAKARTYYEKLTAVAAPDSTRPALREARTFLKETPRARRPRPQR